MFGILVFIYYETGESIGSVKKEGNQIFDEKIFFGNLTERGLDSKSMENVKVAKILYTPETELTRKIIENFEQAMKYLNESPPFIEKIPDPVVKYSLSKI